MAMLKWTGGGFVRPSQWRSLGLECKKWRYRCYSFSADISPLFLFLRETPSLITRSLPGDDLNGTERCRMPPLSFSKSLERRSSVHAFWKNSALSLQRMRSSFHETVRINQKSLPFSILTEASKILEESWMKIYSDDLNQIQHLRPLSKPSIIIHQESEVEEHWEILFALALQWRIIFLKNWKLRF